MTETIIKILKECGIQTWFITEKREDTAELYFIKKELDIPRIKSMTSYVVIVMNDATLDAPDGSKRPMRGVANALISPGMSEADIRTRILDAYKAAGFARNPFYELPEPVVAPHKASASDIASMKIEDAVTAWAKGLFEVDTAEDAFINSVELFVIKTYCHLISSKGTDVSFDKCEARGELVAQCIAPADVEQFRQFSFDHLDIKGLQKKAVDAINDVRARARSKSAPKAGIYSILLTGENLAEVLSYYASRSASALIYPGYSEWKVGTAVQSDVTYGEKLNLDLVASDPYSREGIPMVDRPLMKDGVLQTIHGASRFAYYLGIEPTGDYEKIRLNAGTRDLASLKTESVLEPISFSDFQMDWADGHFKGEMRLALLYHADGTVEELSGGSINGCLPDVENRLLFSKERYSDSSYEGPLAVLIPDVPVAGE